MNDKMQLKTKTKIVIVCQSILSMFFNLSVLIMVCGFFLVFINANIEYFQDLPSIFLIAIPFGFLGMMTKIFMINWWGFYLSPLELEELNRKSPSKMSKRRKTTYGRIHRSA